MDFGLDLSFIHCYSKITCLLASTQTIVHVSESLADHLYVAGAGKGGGGGVGGGGGGRWAGIQSSRVGGEQIINICNEEREEWVNRRPAWHSQG